MNQSRSLPYPAIQIAGVIDRAEAELLVRLGATHLGFPLRLPVHKEDLSEAAASEIIRRLPPTCPGVLITYLERADEVVEFCRQLGARHVQLHGGLAPDQAARLRERDPGLFVIKSLVVRPDNVGALVAQVRELDPFVDAYITDTFDPRTGASGATGKTHDWAVSVELVKLSARPVILAGGMRPGNVREAVRRVRPAGVDAHTGVEGPDGRKDGALVRRFIEEARLGFAELARE
ncbi:MAG TPA: phosphoribosylanthranilate isomerase [Kiritimatiellia bacterium]|nr:phosphoribosylanthranilate isomerase [Kiritimatiellia bacterium]HRZ13517.1 phosphoribosylanthranilate isomerase [Kiritimatiellia bacterium]HSA19178.1 phosphoribosylanthranilate isomerase [Kiritimatiellia bacterium]